MKFVMKNGSFWIGKTPAPAAAAVTAATAGADTALTVTNTAAVGDVAIVAGSGWPALDGRPARVITATSSSVTLEADTTGQAGSPNAGATVQFMDASDWLELCLAGLELDSGTVETITIGTYCDAGAALAGAPSNGTVNINGFLDVTEAGFLELEKAAEDGMPRNFKLVLPRSANPASTDGTGGVYYFLNATVGAISKSFPVGQAVTFTSSLVLSSKPVFVPAQV